MADYTWYDKVTRERVFELPLPSNWAEVGKMISHAQRALEEKEPGSSRWDDAVKVTSDGESLFLTMDIEEKKETIEVESIDDQERCIILDANEDILGWTHPSTGVFYNLTSVHRTSKGLIWEWAGGFEADEELLGGLLVPLMNLTAGVDVSERRRDVRLTHVLRDNGPLYPHPSVKSVSTK